MELAFQGASACFQTLRALTRALASGPSARGREPGPRQLRPELTGFGRVAPIQLRIGQLLFDALHLAFGSSNRPFYLAELPFFLEGELRRAGRALGMASEVAGAPETAAGAGTSRPARARSRRRRE